jgi:hypothetical protein
VLIAIPLLIQTHGVFGYGLARLLKLPFDVVVLSAMIGASNFFELAGGLSSRRVRIRFKSAWKDGIYSVLLDLLFISRLCALIPPPRFSHGALSWRGRRPLARLRGSGPARIVEGRKLTRTE